MEQLILQSTKTFPKVGDVVEGTVVSFAHREVLVDIDGIAVGVVRGKEIDDESGEMSDLKPGDKVFATVLELENEKGILELSFRSASHRKAWDQLNKLKKDNESLSVTIMDANRGGLMARVGGVLGFIPVSQLSNENYPKVEGGDKNKILEKLKSLIGKKIDVKVIAVDEQANKLIISEKSTLSGSETQEMGNLKVGDTIEGVVTGVVDFGAFVQIDGGGEGLIHISEIDWQRIENLKSVVAVGDKVKAIIIDFNEGKASLSVKRLKPDPWKEDIKKYEVGQVVEGTVVKINPFGAFVQIEPTIQGLAHISELSDKPVQSPHDIVKEGEVKSFKIISIEPDNHRLGLSLK